MISKKKKGFTLVELIAALAILAISMIGIYLAFDTSSIIWRKTSETLEIVSHSQSIAQNLKAQGKYKVKQINDHITTGNVGCYLFFNDYDEIKSTITNNNYSKYISTLSPTFNDCKTNNLDDKTYGAFIKIVDDKPPLSYYNFYKITLTVWDLKKVELISGELPFFLGR
jgi:prepilin-type N-terminal cleavage/methylation domain-containing protein